MPRLVTSFVPTSFPAAFPRTGICTSPSKAPTPLPPAPSNLAARFWPRPLMFSKPVAWPSSGILQDHHATGSGKTNGRGQNLAAKLLGAGGSGVGAFDGDVQIPVRGNAAGKLVGTKLVTSRGIASFELEHRVDLVWADGHVLGGPAEDLTIEIRGGGLIGGAKFDPAEFAGSVFFDVGHDGERVPLRGDGGKREEKNLDAKPEGCGIRSGVLAGGAEGRREDDEGGAIKQHPVAGEAAPDDGRGRLDMLSRGCLGKEDGEVDECVGEKEIEQIAKPGRALGNDFPGIHVAGAPGDLPAQESRHYKRMRAGLPLRRRGGGRGGAADGVTVDDELDAAVALAALRGVVRSDGLHFAEAAGGDGRRSHALFGEKIADGVGAALGELLIEIIAADAVGVAFDLKREARMGEHDAGNFRELFARAGLERVTACVKEDVRHVDDEAAGGIARLQNGI